MIIRNFYEIEDLKKTWKIDSLESIESLKHIFGINYNGYNCFWIRIIGKNFPSFSLAVNHNLATANYFRAENIIFVSKSTSFATKHSTINFYMNSLTEKQEMSCSVVVKLTKSIEAAIEFIQNPEKEPASIEWMAL